MEEENHRDPITIQAIKYNPEIENILRRIPDEKLNTSTTGRSNAAFISLSDREKNIEANLNNNVTEEKNDDFKPNNIQNIQNQEINEIDSHNINQPQFNMNLLSETIKSEEIITNAKEILLIMLILSIILWSHLQIFQNTLYLFCLIITLEGLFLFYLIYKTIKKSMNYKFASLEVLNILITTALILLSFENNYFPLHICFINYPIIHIFVWIMSSKTLKKQWFYIILMIRIFIFFQIFQILLKLESIIFWEWKTVFWITWISLVTVGFYLMGIFILLLLTLYYSCIGEADYFQLKGLFWCFNNISNFSIGIFICLIGEIRLLNDKGTGFLKISFLIIITWSVVNLIYTQIFYEDILKFINILITEKDENQNMEIRFIDNDSINNKKEVFEIKSTNEIPDNMPHFLLKFSSTYFQKSNITRDLLQSIKKTKFLIKKTNINTSKSIEVGKGKEDQKSMIEYDIRDKNQSIELRNFNPQEFTMTLEKNDEIKPSPRSISFNQSINNCLICYDKLPDSVLMECGHGGLCYDCSIDIWKKTGECYLCRSKITKIYQIDMRGGIGNYKPIIKMSTMEKKLEEEDINFNNIRIDDFT